MVCRLGGLSKESDVMKPFYFGPSEKQLFGAYHAPADDAPERAVAVVLAYPGLPEYNMAHWAFRRLAGQLARDGFATLRFDYHGTGDSSGEIEDGSLAQWVEDIRSAAGELRDLSGARGLSLVGMRLGASLAARAVAEGLTVRDLVLWDPVGSGTRYLDELEQLDTRQRRERLYPRTRASDELLGYALSPAARSELAALDLARLPWRADQHVVLVASQERPEHTTLLHLLQQAGARASLEVAVEHASRAEAAEGQAALLAQKPLAAITKALVAAEAA